MSLPKSITITYLSIIYRFTAREICHNLNYFIFPRHNFEMRVFSVGDHDVSSLLIISHNNVTPWSRVLDKLSH